MSLLPVGIGNAGGEYTIDNSLRFRSSASADLQRTPSTAGNRKTWTWSCWLKLSSLPAQTNLLASKINGLTYPNTAITIRNTGVLRVWTYTGSTFYINKYTTQVFRDPSAWYHIIVALDTTDATAEDRCKIYVNGERVTSFGTNTNPSLNRDLYINDTTTHTIGGSAAGSSGYLDGYLTEINFIDGQALDPTEFGETDNNTGVWKPKEYQGTYGTNGFYLPTTATTQAEGFNTVLYTGTGATQTIGDVGFNPDLVVIKDRTNAYIPNWWDSVRGIGKVLASDRTSDEATLALAGGNLTSFNTDGFTVAPGTVNSSWLSNSSDKYVAWCWDAGANQATTGISSILYKGTGGAVSLKGFGFSPDLVWIKNRDGTAQNHMVFDSVRGPELRLQPDNSTSELDQSGSLISFDSDGFSFGTSTGNLNSTSSNYVAWGWDAGDGDPVSNTQGDITSTVKASDATGVSIISWTGSGVADDRVGHGLNSAPEVVIYKDRNGTGRWYVWTTAIDGSDDYLFLDDTNAANNISSSYTSPTSTTISNFGYGSSTTMMAYCFKSVSGVSSIGVYSGTGTSGNSVTGLGFKPGFIMIKRTDSATSGYWIMLDSTRDPFNSADSSLTADLPNNETANNTAVAVDFDDDGFTVQGTGSGVNNASGTYLYMAFKGSYSDYVSPLNDTGTIDSRVKANPDKGFSIVSYEGNGTSGSTVGHGLSSAPEMVIVKNRDGAYNWIVGNDYAGTWNGVMFLDTTAGWALNNNQFNSTAPTSSVFTVGSAAATNGSSNNMIAYCWHSVAGYSDIGSYTGTGTTTGPVVTTGFRPGFVLIKQSSSAGNNWVIYDNARNPSNPVNGVVYPNATNAEFNGSTVEIEFTDTGFQPKVTWSAINASSSTYIYMAFADTRDAQFNFDASGNKNNWTPNNINSNASSETSYDIMTDVPTLTDENTANYATINPLDNSGGTTIADANLKVTWGSASDRSVLSTIAIPNTGKFYAEFTNGTLTSASVAVSFGLATAGSSRTGMIASNMWVYYASNQSYIYRNGTASSQIGSNQTIAANGIVQVAIDRDNDQAWLGYNNVWVNATNGTDGNPSEGTNPTVSSLPADLFIIMGLFANSGNINFGQRPFAYTPPTGFLPLNTYNLPDSTIVDGSEHFNTVLYTGTGTTNNSVTGVGFQPDFTWIKDRTAANYHSLHDAARGVGQALQTNTASAELSYSDYFGPFSSDGFTVAPVLSGSNYNASGNAYVAWNWKANGSGTSNTVGVTPSTVSANTTAGFSIVSYTGTGANTTVGHGLGLAPDMMIVKDRDGSNNWIVYARSQGAANRATLNTTNAWSASATSFNSTDPTSTVFSLGSSAGTNTSGREYINYVFASVEGFSSIGTYTGNGSSDGPFVYTGFRPAWLLMKRTDSTSSWYLNDSIRSPDNDTTGEDLYPNLTNAEGGTVPIDILSNGFKVRNSNNSRNASGGTYIYAAFAENPFKNSLAR